MREALRRYWIQLALVAVAAVWGATFVMVKDAVAGYPLYSFLALRFLIAVVAFVVIFPRSVRGLDAGVLRVGLLAGAFMCVGYVFQTWGLQGTTASKAAFITGMFVVITPIMQAVILRHAPRWPTIVGVVFAVVGLALLTGGSSGGWNVGDTRVLICAIAYSAHMIVLGSIGRRHDALPLTLVQIAVTALVCGAIAVATEPIALPDRRLGMGRAHRDRGAGFRRRLRGADVRAAPHPACSDCAHPDHRAGVRRAFRLARG